MMYVPRDWKVGLVETTIAGVRLHRSARVEDPLRIWAEEGVDVEAFVRKHADPAIGWSERSEAKYVWDAVGSGTFTGHGLSFMDGPPRYDGMRVILVDTAERTLLIESYDLRFMLEQKPLSKEALVCWRAGAEAARETGEPIRSAAEATLLLLDEIERLMILDRFEQNEVDLGKFF